MTKRQIELLTREIENSQKLIEMYALTGKAFLAAGNRSKAIERQHLVAGLNRKIQLLTAQLKANGVTL